MMQRYRPSLVDDHREGFLGTVLLLSDWVAKGVILAAEGAVLVFVFLLLSAPTAAYLTYFLYVLIATTYMTDGFFCLMGMIACSLTIFPALFTQFSKCELHYSPTSKLVRE